MQAKNILLTGHTKGIGNALLQQLLDNDVQVTGIARSLTNPHSNLQQLQYDLSDMAEIKKCCNAIKQHKYDAIILNAGYNDIRPAESYSVDELLAITTLNFAAHTAIIKTCLPHLIQNQGYVIAIGSQSGSEVAKWNNYYGAAKAAMHHFMRNLFEQYRKQGLRVTTIVPDITNSDFYAHQQFEPSKDADTYIAPIDIANIIFDLLAKPTSYVTTEIVVRPQRFELKKKS